MRVTFGKISAQEAAPASSKAKRRTQRRSEGEASVSLGELAHEQAIAEDSIRRVENRQGRPPCGIVVGQVGAYDPFSFALSMHGQGYDHHGGVEGADCLYTQQLEGHGPLHRLAQSGNAGLSGATQLAGL